MITALVWFAIVLYFVLASCVFYAIVRTGKDEDRGPLIASFALLVVISVAWPLVIGMLTFVAVHEIMREMAEEKRAEAARARCTSDK